MGVLWVLMQYHGFTALWLSTLAPDGFFSFSFWTRTLVFALYNTIAVVYHVTSKR